MCLWSGRWQRFMLVADSLTHAWLQRWLDYIFIRLYNTSVWLFIRNQMQFDIIPAECFNTVYKIIYASVCNRLKLMIEKPIRNIWGFKVELHEQQNCCNLQQNLISTRVK